MLWAFSLEAVGAGHEIDYSLSSSSKFRNVLNYLVASSHVLMVFCLISAETNMIFLSLKLELCHVKWLGSLSSLVFYQIVLSVTWNIQQ